MKSIYSLLAVAFLSISSIAQNTSNLIVFSEDGLKFYLILNGIRQNETPVINVKVVDLNQPYYSAKIIFEDPKQPVLEKKYLQVTDAEGQGALEVTYKIKKNNKMVNVLRFFSQVPITQAAPPSTEVPVVHFNTTPMPEISTTVVTQETTVTSGNIGNTNTNISTGSNGANTNVSVNMGGVGINMNVNINDPTLNNSTSTSYTTTTTTTTTNSNLNTNTASNSTQNVSNANSCAAANAMSSSSFLAAKQTITKQSFEDTRLTTVKQILKSNCLSCAQIKEVMLLFSFEANRLEVAKIAHDRCVDKNNYFLLNDAFQFESSVEELNSSLK
jgi:hypothetical protein